MANKIHYCSGPSLDSSACRMGGNGHLVLDWRLVTCGSCRLNKYLVSFRINF